MLLLAASTRKLNTNYFFPISQCWTASEQALKKVFPQILDLDRSFHQYRKDHGLDLPWFKVYAPLITKVFKTASKIKQEY